AGDVAAVFQLLQDVFHVVPRCGFRGRLSLCAGWEKHQMENLHNIGRVILANCKRAKSGASAAQRLGVGVGRRCCVTHA
ncbi:MAG: hypothetical protein U1D06_01060, partial [Paracoccaceae bacterium]|nr:hypothetical protein [Paracoccaceae bacterium]